MDMTTQTRSQCSLSQEWIVDLLPRPDGVRFVRGALLGIILCLPIWLFVWWAVTGGF